MREILFRGKRTDNGEWVEGSLVIRESIPYIRFEKPGVWFDDQEVIPETVGQYTGLEDRNGKKIFEGDVFEHGGSTFCEPERFEVGYLDASFCHRNVTKQSKYWDSFADGEFGLCGEWCTVIGNIHDNPELLEVEKDER